MPSQSQFAQNLSKANQSAYTIEYIIQTLDSLLPHVQKYPGYLDTLFCAPSVTLVSPSASGGKFWNGVAISTGLNLTWGKSGSNGTTQHLILAKCKHLNPVLELKERIIRKLNKGYGIMPYKTFLP